MRKYAFRSVLALVLFAALLPLCTGAQASDLGVERKVYQYLTTELDSTPPLPAASWPT